MTKFYQYINEGRTKYISEDMALRTIRKNCKKNFKMLTLSPNKIFRGIHGFKDDFGIIDTNKGNLRKSANTKNYMTLLMDNLSSWNNMPKRSKSIICTNSKMYAGGYGQIYNVIPFDNTKIAIAPSNDIWLSFNFLNDNNYDIMDFNDDLSKMFNYNNIKVNDSSYQSLENGLRELQQNYKDNPIKINTLFENLLNSKDIIKKLNDLMDPLSNGFMGGIDKISKLYSSEREIWIQGQSILIGKLGKVTQDSYDYIWDKL